MGRERGARRLGGGGAGGEKLGLDLDQHSRPWKRGD